MSEWGIEDTGDHLWIGPMRKDGSGKVLDIVAHFDLIGLTPAASQRHRDDASLIAQAPALKAEVERLSEQIERMREPIPIGVGAVAIAQGHSADDPDQIGREVVIYPIDQLPAGTELPADMGKTSTELNALVRLRIVDPDGAHVLLETIQDAIDAAWKVADEATPGVNRA